MVYPPTSIPSECFLNSDLYVDTVESSDRVPELIQYCVRDEGYHPTSILDLLIHI